MDWIELLPIIPWLFTTVMSVSSFVLAIRQYLLSKKTQILRPHSDRLMEVFKKWLETEKFLPPIKDVANIGEEHDIYVKPQPTSDLISSIPFALQHLETGYFQLFSKLKELERQIEEYNKSVEGFVNSLHLTIKNKIELSESARNDCYAYYRRMVSYVLRKILIGYPELVPEIVERKPRYELQWAGAGLIIGSKENCEKGLKLISELKSSDSIIQKAKNLHHKAKELNAQRNKLYEMLYYNVVSKIQVGGIIQGKCDACSR
jgi:hypothetical protein